MFTCRRKACLHRSLSFPKLIEHLNAQLFLEYKQEHFHAGSTGLQTNCPHPAAITALKSSRPFPGGSRKSSGSHGSSRSLNHRSAPGSRCCRCSAAASVSSSRSSSTTAIRPISSCLRSQAKTQSDPSKTPLLGSSFGSLTSSCPETSHHHGDLKDVDHMVAVVHQPLVPLEA